MNNLPSQPDSAPGNISANSAFTAIPTAGALLVSMLASMAVIRLKRAQCKPYDLVLSGSYLMILEQNRGK